MVENVYSQSHFNKLNSMFKAWDDFAGTPNEKKVCETHMKRFSYLGFLMYMVIYLRKQDLQESHMSPHFI